MPFTLSHAAAILPGLHASGAARGRLIASGLVFGSFAPDVPYFLAQWEFGELAHSPVGVPTVDVGIALGLTLCWLLMREPLVALLPERRRGPVYAVVAQRTSRSLPSFVFWFWISASIGAATHVVWDSFTHSGRLAVRTIPLLEQTVAGYPAYRLLQYGCSVLGMLVLLVFIIFLVRQKTSVDAPPSVPGLSTSARRVALAWIVLAVAFPVPQAIADYQRIDPGGSVVVMAPAIAFAGGAGLGVGLLLYAAAFRATAKLR